MSKEVDYTSASFFGGNKKIGGDKLENTKVKKYFDRLSEESRNILVAIIEDSLAYLDSQELITTTELGRLASFYFVLIINIKAL